MDWRRDIFEGFFFPLFGKFYRPIPQSLKGALGACLGQIVVERTEVSKASVVDVVSEEFDSILERLSEEVCRVFIAVPQFSIQIIETMSFTYPIVFTAGGGDECLQSSLYGEMGYGQTVCQLYNHRLGYPVSVDWRGV